MRANAQKGARQREYDENTSEKARTTKIEEVLKSKIERKTATGTKAVEKYQKETG